MRQPVLSALLAVTLLSGSLTYVGSDRDTSSLRATLVSASATADAALVWGANDAGQLANGTTNSGLFVAPLAGVGGIKAIEQGPSIGAVVYVDGTVATWGLIGTVN